MKLTIEHTETWAYGSAAKYIEHIMSPRAGDASYFHEVSFNEWDDGGMIISAEYTKYGDPNDKDGEFEFNIQLSLDDMRHLMSWLSTEIKIQEQRQ